jgi:hypothetical protein
MFFKQRRNELSHVILQSGLGKVKAFRLNIYA